MGHSIITRMEKQARARSRKDALDRYKRCRSELDPIPATHQTHLTFTKEDEELNE